MAYATSITIATGNKVSMNYQSQDVSVSLTYQLERDDTDLLALVERKAAEVEKAHRTAWRRIRDERLAEQAASNGNGSSAGAAAANGADSATGTNGATTNGGSPGGNPAHDLGIAKPPTTTASPSKAQNGTKAPDTEPPQSDAPSVDAATTSVTASQPERTPQAQREGMPRPGAAAPSQRPVTTTQVGAIRSLAARLGLTDEELSRRTDIRCGRKSIEELSELQATSLILELQRNAPVIAGAKSTAVPAQTNGSGEEPHQEEPQGGNGHGKRTRRAAARS